MLSEVCFVIGRQDLGEHLSQYNTIPISSQREENIVYQQKKKMKVRNQCQ